MSTPPPPPATAHQRARIRPREWVGVVTVVAFGVGLPLLAAYATGAIDVPRNDDWSYSRSALTMAATGEFRLVGWAVMSLVGQVLWAQPWMAVLGDSLRSLHLATAAASAIGLVATFLLARRFLAPVWALLVTAILAVAPAYAVQSTSFMTDPLAFAGQITAVALAAAAFDRRGRHRAALLAGALVAGVAAFTVREVAAAAVLAVLVAMLWAVRDPDLKPDGRRRARLGVGTAALLAVGSCVAFYIWRVQLPNHQVGFSDFDPGATVLGLVRGWCTLGLAVSPALLLGPLRGWRPSRRALYAAGLVVLAGIGVALRDVSVGGVAADAPLLPGNALTRFGSMGNAVLSGTKPPLIPDAAWVLIVAWALAAGGLLAARAAAVLEAEPLRSRLSGLGPQGVLLGVFALLSLGAGQAYPLVGGAVFDRYLWAGAVIVTIGLLRAVPWPPKRAAVPALAALAALAVLGGLTLIVTVEEYAFAAARWSAGEALVAQGVPPDAIDAGFAWMGYHHDGVAFDESRPLRIAQPHPGYALIFRGSSNCFTVSASPLDDELLEPRSVRAYRALPLLPVRELFVYRHPAVCAAIGV